VFTDARIQYRPSEPEIQQHHEETDMSPVLEPTAGPYVVVAAWYCDECDVQGRSLADAEVACWNCDGQVTVTARPALRIEDL
jgi:hypothetical protein